MTRLTPSSSAVAILLAMLFSISVTATISPLPTSSYVNGTRLVTIPATDETMLSSISHGFPTIGFSTVAGEHRWGQLVKLGTATDHRVGVTPRIMV